jgi:hypothetical protein
VYVKPRVFPRIEQFDAVCFEKIQFDQKLNDTCPAGRPRRGCLFRFGTPGTE